MKKLEALKVGGSKEKKKEKKHVLWGEKLIFLAIFSSLLVLCTSKMISKAWGSAPMTF